MGPDERDSKVWAVRVKGLGAWRLHSCTWRSRSATQAWFRVVSGSYKPSVARCGTVRDAGTGVQ
jgi:hypothetical protein